MQTILVPIDFTAAADYALVYANKLALRLPAEIVLVHAGTGTALPPEQRAALVRRLEALAERLRYQQLTRQSGRRIQYHYHVAAEPLADCLQMLVAGYQADFVVMGLALSDCAAATAAGTPLTLLPERVSCPVLVVPAGRHELPGRVADASLPWAMLWPGVEGPRHPSPLYQALVDGVLVFAILWLFARKARPRFAVGAMFALLYGCARFYTEYFRVPDWQVSVGGWQITSGQVLSTPMIIAGLVILKWAYSQAQQPQQPRPAANK